MEIENDIECYWEAIFTLSWNLESGTVQSFFFHNTTIFVPHFILYYF